MLQASPSGDDSIIGRQASQGPPPSLRTVFSLTGASLAQSLLYPSGGSFTFDPVSCQTLSPLTVELCSLIFLPLAFCSFVRIRRN